MILTTITRHACRPPASILGLRGDEKQVIDLEWPNLKKRRKLWSDEAMVNAMAAVQSGEMGVNKAALEYGVPKTTLKDRIAGRVVHGKKPGPEPLI